MRTPQQELVKLLDHIYLQNKDRLHVTEILLRSTNPELTWADMRSKVVDRTLREAIVSRKSDHIHQYDKDDRFVVMNHDQVITKSWTYNCTNGDYLLVQNSNDMSTLTVYVHHLDEIYKCLVKMDDHADLVDDPLKYCEEIQNIWQLDTWSTD